MTQASTGRIVHYTLTEDDAARINARLLFNGSPGNVAEGGDVLPLMVVKAFPQNLVNGQVFTDGSELYWVTSRPEGDGRGQWQWPPRV